MSTITVAKKNGYAAIAADSLTTYGSLREAALYVVNHQKIIQVQGSYLGICGPTSGKLILNDYFSSVTDDVRLDTVEAIFRTWLALHEVVEGEILPQTG